MAHRYLPVDRDQPAFLPLNMCDWVPKDHVVWLVIDTVEQLGTPELAARLAGGTRKSARGRRAYHPVMLLTLLAYAYCSGVLSTRAIEARCQVDATFRLACAGLVPDHSTISRFRQRACGDGGPMEEVFYAVLRVCAAARAGAAERGGCGRGQDRGECVEGGEPDRGGAAQAGRGDHGRGRLPMSRERRRRVRTCSAGRCWARGGLIRGRGWPGCGCAWRTSPPGGMRPGRPGGRRARPGWTRRRPASR